MWKLKVKKSDLKMVLIIIGPNSHLSTFYIILKASTNCERIQIKVENLIAAIGNQFSCQTIVSVGHGASISQRTLRNAARLGQA